MIKLISTDMDHSLLDNDSHLPPNIKEILDLCEEKGVFFVAASGRTMHSIETKFGELASRIIKISDNGSQLKIKDKLVDGSLISYEDAIKAIEVGLSLKETSVVVTAVDKVYINCVSDTHKGFLAEYYQNSIFLDDVSQYADQAIKITFLSIDNTLDNFNSVVSKELRGTITPTLSGKVWIDVIRNDVSKGNTLNRLLTDLNISPTEAAAFGDYDNDITMLEAVKYSYAVSNASQSVKEVASEVIGSNDDQAVAHKIIELLGQ
ncbi:hypothetical protein AOC36_00050 [Erysipelothrix larvae]|uniref:Hydrolase n=1 Tax=Erysipelothrix larvae TaxID=1514105 RepID=A0A120JTB9_9FIRM|nr:HAD-IIB family hydrolase [Erysipelothrix larvae]AMC92439.1 hypothetical protein AOC36_00050 [Erysipelothrix larvae]